MVKGTDFPRDKYSQPRAHKECRNQLRFRWLRIAQILPTRTPAFFQAVHLAVKGFEGGGYLICGVHLQEAVLFAVFYQREALNVVV